MNLSEEERQELNSLLKNTSLELPDFRREVSISGNNYIWLQKNIIKKNSNINSRIKELLRI